MKPYYETANGKLYLGDCLEVMKQLDKESIDMIASDPPYGLDYNNDDLAYRRESVFGGDRTKQKPNNIPNDDEEKAMNMFELMLQEFSRILKKGGCCCCCCCGGGGPKPLFAKWTLLMDKYLQFKQAIVWDKPGLGMGIHYRRSYEFVLVANKKGASCIWNGGKTQSNIVRFSKIIPQATDHPTIKPVALMAWMIGLHSNKNSLVLDPFIGSGTTAIACEKLNRKWIGIEISEKYCEMAKKRIKAEITQLKCL